MSRVAVIASTGGGVLGAVLTTNYVRERVAAVLVDRDCGAAKHAKRFGVPLHNFQSIDKAEFENRVAHFIEEGDFDLIFSFYTRLFSDEFVTKFGRRLINFHPSILPSFPGMDGFGDTVRSAPCFIGASVHFIDSGMDTGRIIVQCALPFNPSLTIAENRHAVFVSQCKMFIQILSWFERGMLKFPERNGTCIKGAQYKMENFSPNLDCPIAIEFNFELNT